VEQIEHSYRRQASSEDAMELPSRYLRPHSIDNWRHTRMLDLTAAIRRACPGASWLTVGDGRYGSDAAYLHAQGVDVVATSLTDEKLRHAHAQGHIPAYRAENAERLSQGDGSVDFVLCKEAYHHFPRPPVALYEMLRVARVAVVLIEPLDNPRLLDGMKAIAKRLLRGDREQQFEPSGNFLYRLNIRELGKLMTAMGGRTLAFKGINDFYHARLGDCDARALNFGSAITKAGVVLQDLLSAGGLLGYGLGCVVVFKGDAETVQLQALRGAGFSVVELPRNPYAN
jgi:SAM-dependent methyltransferase